jgi:hypothetical protein
MRSKGLWSLRKQLELLCLLFDDDLPVETSIKRAIGASFQPKAWDVWNQETGEMYLWRTIDKTLWQRLLLGLSLQAPSSHITRQLVTRTFWKSHILSLTSHIWQWWPVNVELINKMKLWSKGCQSSWSSVRCSPFWEHLTRASVSVVLCRYWKAHRVPHLLRTKTIEAPLTKTEKAWTTSLRFSLKT